MKLQLKVILIVIGIMAIVGIISGGMMLYFQRRASVNQFEHMGIALTGVLQSSLEQGMLTGERQVTQDAMVRIGQEDLVTDVHLLDSDGTIAASSHLSDIGLTLDADEILTTMQTGEVSIGARNQDGINIFQVVTPIMNKVECQGCHNANSSVLGAIAVGLDTTTLNSQTTRQNIYIGILGGCTFLIIGISLAFALKKAMINPLSKLTESALSFTNGDYKARADATKKDEIGMPAKTFNLMAESVALHTSELEFSRKQLAKWNLDLEDKIQRRTKELSALNTVITTVSQSLNQYRILNDAIKKILGVMDIEAGCVYLLDDKTGYLITKIQGGLSQEYTKEATKFEPDQSLLGKVVQSKEPMVISNIAENSEFGALLGEKGSFRSCISVPIRSKNEILGALSLISGTPNRFDYEMVPLISAMGDAIGVAIDNARTAQSLEEAKEIRDHLLEKLISAQEDERRRIARELHDEASQFLAALTLNLESIADVLPPKFQDIKQKIDILKNRAIETIGSIRTLALELRPSVLDDLGLSKAVEWYAKDYLTKQGLDVEIEIVEPKPKIPAYTETMLFRIIQEALTNIIKHAEASHVIISLNLVGSTGIMRIEDNGKGFDIEPTLAGEGSWQYLGLHGMSERVTLIGGKFTINSTVGQGTVIEIKVPLEGRD